MSGRAPDFFVVGKDVERIASARAELAQELPLGLPELPREQEVARALSKAGQFTGQQLWDNDRARYVQIVSQLAEGATIRSIATAHRVSSHTVLAIRDRENGEIATRKRVLAGKMLDASEMAVDQVIANMDKLAPDKAAITASVLAERARELLGEAGETTLHVHVGMGIDQFRALVTGSRDEEVLPERGARGTVIEMEPATLDHCAGDDASPHQHA